MKSILKKLKTGRLLLIFSGLSITFLLLTLYWFQPSLLASQNLKIYDLFLTTYHNANASQIPIIVDLDEKSFATYGQWPWPRYVIARLLKNIRELGASSVGIDILFAESDRTSPKQIQQSLLKEFNTVVEFKNLPAEFLDNDEVLASMLSQGPYVLGYYFNFDTHQQESVQNCVLHPIKLVKMASTESLDTDVLPQAPGVVCNLRQLSEAAAGSGFIDTFFDADGMIRRTPLLMKWDGNIYPSLALATLLQSIQPEQMALYVGAQGIEYLRLDHRLVPLDARGNLLLHYRGKRQSFKYISAFDILTNRVPAHSLKDKIVFIGSSAKTLSDIKSTPLEQFLPGVEVHATVVDNILQEDFLAFPDWAVGLEVMLIVFCGIISTLLLTWTRAGWSLLLLCLGGGTIVYGAVWLFKSYYFFISPLASVLTILINFSLLTLLKFMREESEKKYFYSAFSHYVSKSVLDQLLESRDKLTLDGEEREVSILFVDIRNFTRLSERLTSSQVCDLLQAYFTPMTKLITTYKGTLDKYIGDCIMAFWNAPIDVKEHQRQAVLAALNMQIEMKRLLPLFKERFDLDFEVGIGIHSGNVRIGNMGSEDLFDYTIIGDNVNLASRIEGLTKIYGVSLLVSEVVKNACHDAFVFQEVDTVRVKGKAHTVTVFAVYPMEDEQLYREELIVYARALDMFRDGQYVHAERQFVALGEYFRDIRLYQLYRERCLEMLKKQEEK